MLQSNYNARESLNNQYAQIKGSSSINDVATGFGQGWLIFAILSSAASAFSFYHDFYRSIDPILTVILVVVLAVALEAFKHLSIRGMFSSMNKLSKSLMTILAIGLIITSFYTHYKSIKTFQSNLVTDDLKNEIAYQRDIQKVQNAQINTILETNGELAKAFNNGGSADDILSADSQKSNNELISTLSKLSAQNNMTNTNLLLRESKNSAKTTASAILVIFIMIEIMALFSIVSKIIVIDNISENVKSFFNVLDKLEELESNTYKSLGFQKIEQTHEKISNVSKVNHANHEQEMKRLKNQSQQVTAYTGEKSDSTKLSGLASQLGLTEEELVATLQKYIKKDDTEECHEVPTIGSDIVPYAEYNDETEVEISNQKVKAIDIKSFSDLEQKLLQILYRNGTTKVGEFLMKRDDVLKRAKELHLKGSAAALTSLLRNLHTYGYVSIDNGGNGTYKCVQPLPQRNLWVKKS